MSLNLKIVKDMGNAFIRGEIWRPTNEPLAEQKAGRLQVHLRVGGRGHRVALLTGQGGRPDPDFWNPSPLPLT